MAVDTDMILTVGRFIPDAGAPEGRTVRMEDYLAALSRELETLYIRMNDLLRELDGRTAALAAACRPTGGGPTHVELVACVDPVLDINWLADWLSRRTDTACAVAVDGKAGAGRLYDLLETFHVPRNYVIRATTDQAVTAAALTVEGVRNRTVTHIECPALDESARNSPRRPIGKTGAWGWGGDAAAPVEAVGLALLAITTSKRDPSRRQVVW